MAVLKTNNNISESLGSINIPNSGSIKINTTSFSDFNSVNGQLNNNQDKSGVSQIDYVNLEDIPEDAIDMKMYDGRLVKSAKEKTDEIKKEVKKVCKKYSDKVDIDKVIDESYVEEILVKYMEENNTTEVDDKFISSLIIQISKRVFAEYSSDDIAPPKLPEMHELTDEEEEEMKEKIEL